MNQTEAAAPSAAHVLTLTRLIDAPREKAYRAWTEPALLTQWFAPLPYTTPSAQLDVRPGGASRIVMRGPDGIDMPNPASSSRSCRTNGWCSRTPIWAIGFRPRSPS